MLAPLVLELLSLAAVLWACVALLRSKKRTGADAARAAGIPLALVGLLLVAAVALNVVIYFNAPGAETAAALGSRTGLQSRADAWLEKHAATPLEEAEVMRNMRILEEGLVFLRPYRGQLAPHVQLQLDEFSRMPTKPTRILSPSEERDYLNAARKVVDAVRSLGSNPK